jgi:hypothetical protein
VKIVVQECKTGFASGDFKKLGDKDKISIQLDVVIDVQDSLFA